MEYTKGKWEITIINSQFGNTIKRQITYRINNDLMNDIYALPRHRNNARLISASPDLLEACKYVVKYHREHDSGEGELYGLDFVTTCISAIAKAEGR